MEKWDCSSQLNQILLSQLSFLLDFPPSLLPFLKKIKHLLYRGFGKPKPTKQTNTRKRRGRRSSAPGLMFNEKDEIRQKALT